VIGRQGIEKIIELKLNTSEKAQLRKAAKSIAAMNAQLP